MPTEKFNVKSYTRKELEEIKEAILKYEEDEFNDDVIQPFLRKLIAEVTQFEFDNRVNLILEDTSGDWFSLRDSLYNVEWEED